MSELVTSCPCGRLSSKLHPEVYVVSGSKGLKLIIHDLFIRLFADYLLFVVCLLFPFSLTIRQLT